MKLHLINKTALKQADIHACMSPTLNGSSALQRFEHDKYTIQYVRFLPRTATYATCKAPPTIINLSQVTASDLEFIEW